MKRWPWFVWVVAVTLAATGCSKHQPAAGAGATNSENGAANAEAQVPLHGPGLPATPQQAVVIADTGNPEATVGQLSVELRRYVLRTQTAPKTFEEFVTKAQVQAPPPPSGKKYALQAGAVILVNR